MLNNDAHQRTEPTFYKDSTMKSNVQPFPTVVDTSFALVPELVTLVAFPNADFSALEAGIK